MQGIRGAVPQDLAAIQALLQPLEARGVLAPRTDAQLLNDLRHFRVAERDAKVAILYPDSDGLFWNDRAEVKLAVNLINETLARLAWLVQAHKAAAGVAVASCV